MREADGYDWGDTRYVPRVSGGSPAETVEVDIETGDTEEDESPGGLHTQDYPPPEHMRPAAERYYMEHIQPFYSNTDLAVIVENDPEAEDVLSQIIGWFHPAFHSRGRPLYKNPGRLGMEVAQEFARNELDIIDNAQEFLERLEEKWKVETKAAFADARAQADVAGPARNVPVGRSTIPGTQEYEDMQGLQQQMADKKGKGKGWTR